MSPRRAAVLSAGLLLILAGALLGWLPRSAARVDCGSPFSPSGQGLASDIVGETVGAQALCDDALSGRLPAFTMLVVGSALVVGAIRTPKPAAGSA
jgi:hypothetical protein